MIAPTEFKSLIDKIGAIFTPLSQNALDRYYEHLNQSPVDLLRKAFFLIEERHAFGRFPLISEIREAMSQIQAQGPYKTAADYELEERLNRCSICGGTGWEVIEGPGSPYTSNRSIARNCSCPRGQQRQEAMKAAQKKGRKKPLPALRYVDKYFDGAGSAPKTDAAEYPPEWDDLGWAENSPERSAE